MPPIDRRVFEEPLLHSFKHLFVLPSAGLHTTRARRDVLVQRTSIGI